MDTQIAVITVPQNEWQEMLAVVKDTRDKVLALAAPEKKELLTPKEVCGILKIGRSTFERMKNAGKIPITKIEGQRKAYVKRADIENMITE